MTSETKMLFVVRASEAAGDNFASNRFADGFRGGYSILEKPRVGDVILDVLIVRDIGDKYQIDSAAAFAKDLRLVIDAVAAWGDQYEPDAEIFLRDAAVSAVLHGQESSPHYGVASCEHGPLHWLRWSLKAETTEPSFHVFGKLLRPAS